MASVTFLNVDSGATVPSPVHLEMAVKGYDVWPASELARGQRRARACFKAVISPAAGVLPSRCQRACSSRRVLVPRPLRSWIVLHLDRAHTWGFICLRPAGEGVVPGTGHFHVIVDRAAAEKLDEGDVIPFDATHLHYGKGQVGRLGTWMHRQRKAC